VRIPCVPRASCLPRRARLTRTPRRSYGKEGDDLAKATKGLIDLVNTVRTSHGGPLVPIYTTEHASKTASSWNLAPSSSDDYFEASRLACQLMWMGSYGLEQCACGRTSSLSCVAFCWMR
jgi:hypothetical protein